MLLSATIEGEEQGEGGDTGLKGGEESLQLYQNKTFTVLNPAAH